MKQQVNDVTCNMCLATGIFVRRKKSTARVPREFAGSLADPERGSKPLTLVLTTSLKARVRGALRERARLSPSRFSLGGTRLVSALLRFSLGGARLVSAGSAANPETSPESPSSMRPHPETSSGSSSPMRPHPETSPESPSLVRHCHAKSGAGESSGPASRESDKNDEVTARSRSP